MLAGQRGAGARFAADACHALGVQRVVGHLESHDRIPYFLARAIGQGIPFVELCVFAFETLIDVDNRDFGARIWALIASLPGHPCAAAREIGSQRINLADAAALGVAVFEKRKWPLLSDEWNELFCARKTVVDRDLIVLFDLAIEAVSLWMEASGIQRKYAIR